MRWSLSCWLIDGWMDGWMAGCPFTNPLSAALSFSIPTTSVTNGEKEFEHIGKEDVVILPAFGATIQEMQLLDEKGVQIVDTTCPWVSKVWTAVEKHRCVSFFLAAFRCWCVCVCL